MESTDDGYKGVDRQLIFRLTETGEIVGAVD